MSQPIETLFAALTAEAAAGRGSAERPRRPTYRPPAVAALTLSTRKEPTARGMHPTAWTGRGLRASWGAAVWG